MDTHSDDNRTSVTFHRPLHTSQDDAGLWEALPDCFVKPVLVSSITGGPGGHAVNRISRGANGMTCHIEMTGSAQATLYAGDGSATTVHGSDGKRDTTHHEESSSRPRKRKVVRGQKEPSRRKASHPDQSVAQEAARREHNLKAARRK